jgi:hypothetical protein
MVAEEDIALKEMEGPTAREAEELAKAKKPDKHEQLCNISQALAVLASASVIFFRLLIFINCLYIILNCDTVWTRFSEKRGIRNPSKNTLIPVKWDLVLCATDNFGICFAVIPVNVISKKKIQ